MALLQAPAESITQSVVYAHHNMMGNGMYLRHGLFLASIILSLGDILVAAVKLCRCVGLCHKRTCLAILWAPVKTNLPGWSVVRASCARGAASRTGLPWWCFAWP